MKELRIPKKQISTSEGDIIFQKGEILNHEFYLSSEDEKSWEEDSFIPSGTLPFS